jgi:hypothetical protein
MIVRLLFTQSHTITSTWRFTGNDSNDDSCKLKS